MYYKKGIKKTIQLLPIPIFICDLLFFFNILDAKIALITTNIGLVLLGFLYGYNDYKISKKLRALMFISTSTILLIVLVGFILTSSKDVGGLKYIRKESMFSTFEIKEDQVYFYNKIVITNLHNKDYLFRMKMNVLSEGDLVTGKEMKGYHRVTNNDIFMIKAKEKKEYPVTFIGERGSGNQKNDRLPPKTLSVEIIK